MQAEVMTIMSAPNQRDPDRTMPATRSPIATVARIWVSRRRAESPLPTLPITSQRRKIAPTTATTSDVRWSDRWLTSR